ncbi:MULTISPECIES: thiamine diphosphokinase [Exiguobacterium]|uniref:Thiamine diphosphokinase n=1 Tax=Exiguobacterium antarcticum TaxID=132920 RepID=A0ABT6QYN8_9BACL|nr:MULTISPECIES: thiamine diphosphokinase [Exiguobacterium]AFS70877.1 thiamine pyrophosphokinase [Exiguobacterium antarcticum B7]MDI3233809.1 thiamine diphosphokinase [Exiguobacterium antarcticum]
MRIIIVAAGPSEEVPLLKPFLFENTRVIGVDGGIATLVDQGIDFDLAIGDFDSLGHIPTGAILHPAEKDETDLELALRYVYEHYEVTELLIFGATGGRIDMTLQNVYLLKQFPEARLVTKQADVRFLPEGRYEIEAEQYHYLSFIPLVSTVLTLCGVKYPLMEQTVPVGGSLTVSNEWTRQRVADIRVQKGEILMIRSLAD